jgi:hypothetical protein
VFWSDGKGGYFRASSTSLLISMVCQLFTLFGQNRKLGLMRVAKESLPVLVGFKPAIDAYRVATGEKQDALHLFDPMLEMTYMKGIEMFAEAIPGVIIQLMAIATTSKGVKISTSAWLSLTVSAVSTGFISASISYDWDTSPNKRLAVPEFYGYVPQKASKRAIVFASMACFSAALLVIRCTTIVILGLMGKKWVFIYIGSDLGFYIVVKLLRGDFWYWIPAGHNFEIPVSIFARVLVKIVTDFTSVVHFRHPNEVGGYYWLFGFGLTMGSLPVAINLAESDLSERATALTWTIVKYLIPISVVCFTVFIKTIERKYWPTFWSTQRSKDLTMSYFLESRNDEMKFAVMKRSRHHWVSIEEKVRKWVEENWARWEEEKPEWFTDQKKATVPVEFIPTTGDARRRESVRRASVDAEVEGGLGGVLRASIRRASIGGVNEQSVRVSPIGENN